jgi:hypothetical protein
MKFQMSNYKYNVIHYLSGMVPDSIRNSIFTIRNSHGH